jgi:hypothetical protein
MADTLSELFGSFFPLCARGSTKSTDMINEFSKILRLFLCLFLDRLAALEEPGG